MSITEGNSRIRLTEPAIAIYTCTSVWRQLAICLIQLPVAIHDMFRLPEFDLASLLIGQCDHDAIMTCR